MSLLAFFKQKLYLWPIYFDGCYDIVQRSTDFKVIAIVHIKNNACRIYFQHMSKHEAKKIMNKFDLIDKSGNIYCNDWNNHNYNHNHNKKKLNK